MPRLTPADPGDVRSALARRAGRTDRTDRTDVDRADLKLLARHFLAVLAQRAPGASVEVRVPPYAAAQVVPGVRHTRGTPPAVVELDPLTWVALALGETSWSEAMAQGSVRASGERADLSPYLPLLGSL